MGQITEALNKIQKSRQDHEGQKVATPYQMRGNLQSNSKIAMYILAAGSVVAVFMSVVVIALDIGDTRSNQKEIHNLEKSVKVQEKGIKDLMSFLVNTKNLSDNQIQDFNFRLKNETEDRKIQINNMSLIDNVYYLNLMKSINANSRQINYLNKYTKNLKDEIEKIPASNNQAKNAPNPTSGN